MRELIINGKPAKVGQEVTMHNGQTGILEGWKEPTHPASTGRVYVDGKEYFPSVIGGKFND